VIIAHELSGSTVTLAATPKPLAYHAPARDALSGRQELLNLAEVAARQPAAAIRHPRYTYAKTMGWYLATRVDGQATTSVVIPSTTESWAAPDGTTHVHRVTNHPDGSRYVDDFTYRGPVPRELSTNEAVLAHQLDIGHPRSIGPVERFVSLTDLALNQPISPARSQRSSGCWRGPLPGELSNVVYLAMKNDQAATLSYVSPSSWLLSSVTLMPSLNFTPSRTSATRWWPLNRRQRSWAVASSL
jgi:hypothetical protein